MSKEQIPSNCLRMQANKMLGQHTSFPLHLFLHPRFSLFDPLLPLNLQRTLFQLDTLLSFNFCSKARKYLE